MTGLILIAALWVTASVLTGSIIGPAIAAADRARPRPQDTPDPTLPRAGWTGARAEGRR